MRYSSEDDHSLSSDNSSVKEESHTLVEDKLDIGHTLTDGIEQEQMYSCLLNAFKQNSHQLQLPMEAEEFYSRCTNCW